MSRPGIFVQHQIIHTLLFHKKKKKIAVVLRRQLCQLPTSTFYKPDDNDGFVLIISKIKLQPVKFKMV